MNNLVQRSDSVDSVTENFCYDGLNRLTNYGINGTSCTTGNTNTVKSVGYDAVGDILAKSDVGTYTYPTAGSALPHAVSSINTTTGCTLVLPENCTVAGTTNPSYSYDANGNMLTGAGRTVTYTAANMIETVTQGSTSYTLNYDTEHARIVQTATSGTTDYINDPTNGAMEEMLSSGGVTSYRDYIMADGKIVAQRMSAIGTPVNWGAANWGSFDWNAPVSVQYFVLDQLGSVAAIATINPSTGAVTTVQQAYDAWGKMRVASTGADDPACALPPASLATRGFTNQEQMEAVCLVNLNARVYDPQIGRFMAADTVIPDTFNTQSYNRYTYVENGPLSYADPTGHDGTGCCSTIAVHFYLYDPEGDTPDASLVYISSEGVAALFAGTIQIGTTFNADGLSPTNVSGTFVTTSSTSLGNYNEPNPGQTNPNSSPDNSGVGDPNTPPCEVQAKKIGDQNGDGGKNKFAFFGLNSSDNDAADSGPSAPSGSEGSGNNQELDTNGMRVAGLIGDTPAEQVQHARNYFSANGIGTSNLSDEDVLHAFNVVRQFEEKVGIAYPGVDPEAIGSAQKADINHRSATFMRGEAMANGTKELIKNNDGSIVLRNTYRSSAGAPGNMKNGTFEYIYDSQGNLVHQLFRPDK